MVRGERSACVRGQLIADSRGAPAGSSCVPTRRPVSAVCEPRDGGPGSSHAVAIVSYPRVARPRGAQWSPRGRIPRGANPVLAPSDSSRPRNSGGAAYRGRFSEPEVALTRGEKRLETPPRVEALRTTKLHAIVLRFARCLTPRAAVRRSRRRDGRGACGSERERVRAWRAAQCRGTPLARGWTGCRTLGRRPPVRGAAARSVRWSIPFSASLPHRYDRLRREPAVSGSWLPWRPRGSERGRRRDCSDRSQSVVFGRLNGHSGASAHPANGTASSGGPDGRWSSMPVVWSAGSETPVFAGRECRKSRDDGSGAPLVPAP